MELGVEVPECSIIELLVIVSDNGMEKPKLADDGFSKEIFYLDFDNIHQWFYLEPFGEVVDGDD